MNNNDHKKSGGATGLIVLAWITSVISVPIYFYAMIGIGMSPGAPHASIGELLMLAICPILALAAIVFSFLRFGFTGWRFISIVLPSLFSLLELIFTFQVLSAG